MLSLSEKAEQSLRMVREAKELSYDTETSGLDWRRNFPVGWVIGSTPQDVVYIPTRHGGGGNLPDLTGKMHVPETATSPYEPHSYEIELAKAFKYRNDNNVGVTIGHHLKFDCHASANVGIMLGRNLTCTQNNQALIDEYSKGFSLEACALAHGVTAKKGDELYQHMSNMFGCLPNRKSMAHFWEVAGDDPIAVDYAVGDGITTLELYWAQMKEIHKQELEQVQGLENELIWTLFRMERRGIRVDMDYLPKLKAQIDDEVAKAFELLPEGFNVRSGPQTKAYVEQFIDDSPTTEKGNPSFTEKWLKTFPEGRNIVTVRKWSNLANSFVTPLIEKHVFKGRVNANLTQLKGEGGGTPARLACSAPNLQAIPKHDKALAKMFRKTLIADEGMVFYEADYSQCEPRLFAHYSEEPVLVEGYSVAPFKDVHTVVAEMFQADRNTTAKRMNMGMFTGMYPKAFAGHMGVSLTEATIMWNKWFATFPAIRGFQDLAKNVIQQRQYVKTLLGRRGRLESNKFAYKAVSKIIQGGNADIIKWKMLEIDKYFEAEGDVSHLLMTVHDSFLWQAPNTDAGRVQSNKVQKIMLDVQSEPFNLRVPFTVDFDEGKNWCEASFGPEDDVMGQGDL